jgi:hypothetical protein
MNLRQRILCERLRLRSRSVGRTWSEDELRQAEDQLGYQLPPMLRHLYLEVGPLRLAAEHLTIDRLPDYVSHSGWRLARAIAKALRAHPGSYVNLEGSSVALGGSGTSL